MKRLKVMTILGTRPEIIRLSEVIKKMRFIFRTYIGPHWTKLRLYVKSSVFLKN